MSETMNKTDERDDCRMATYRLSDDPENMLEKRCRFDAETGGPVALHLAHIVTPEECSKCEHYKSRHIQYPITVKDIENNNMEPWIPRHRTAGSLAAVRPVNEDKTYLGIYLGEFPWINAIAYNPETQILSIKPCNNPLLFIPKLHKTVYGAESWWHLIKSAEDLDDITDKDIENQWYMRLLSEINKHDTAENMQTENSN